MAGQSLGAAASASFPLPPAKVQAYADTNGVPPVQRIQAVSRARRNHGVFVLGAQVCAVYSSRREAVDLGVSLTIGCGPSMFAGGMSATQARAMADALVAAADAVDGCAQAPGLRDIAMRVEQMLTRQRWLEDGPDPEAVLLRDVRRVLKGGAQ